MRVPPLDFSTSLRPQLLRPSALEVRLSTYKPGGNVNVQTKAGETAVKGRKQERFHVCHTLGCVCSFWLFTTPQTVICHAPLSVGFSRQEYWRELPCPPPQDLPDPGIKPTSLASPALTGRFFTTAPPLFGGTSVCKRGSHVLNF